jgi:acetyltransferase EpsM
VSEFEYHIIGYSGHAFVVIDSALSLGWKCQGYFEKEEKIFNPFELSYLGGDAHAFADHNRPLFVAIGNNQVRCQIVQKLISLNFHGFNIIDGQSILSKHSSLGIFNYIAKGAVIQTRVQMGNGCIINSGAVIDHECEIADFAHISPNATLCGGVKIGQRTWVGAGAVIKEGVQIGSDVIIGAGSVVLKNVPDGITCFGVPVKLKSCQRK